MINIDMCYLIIVNRLKDIDNKDENEYISYDYDNLKFSVVIHKKRDKYIDIFSDEIYEKSVEKLSKSGELFINDDYPMIPLNMLIKTNSQHIRKKELLKRLRDAIIDLNDLIFSDDLEAVYTIENVKKIFGVEESQLEFNMYKRRSKK